MNSKLLPPLLAQMGCGILGSPDMDVMDTMDIILMNAQEQQPLTLQE